MSAVWRKAHNDVMSEDWDTHAATFDEEPDHGLRDPAVRAAWAALLLPLIPDKARVADLGCGTGSLSVLLAEAGHQVDALDQSPAMIEIATRKAATAGVTVTFQEGDASTPPYEPHTYDVVLSRHVLWALPDKEAALTRWTNLLTPKGKLILVEGHWFTGAGLPAAECAALVRNHRPQVTITHLTDPALWGHPITDERYLLVS